MLLVLPCPEGLSQSKRLLELASCPIENQKYWKESMRSLCLRLASYILLLGFEILKKKKRAVLIQKYNGTLSQTCGFSWLAVDCFVWGDGAVSLR